MADMCCMRRGEELMPLDSVPRREGCSGALELGWLHRRTLENTAERQEL